MKLKSAAIAKALAHYYNFNKVKFTAAQEERAGCGSCAWTPNLQINLILSDEFEETYRAYEAAHGANAAVDDLILKQMECAIMLVQGNQAVPVQAPVDPDALEDLPPIHQQPVVLMAPEPKHTEQGARRPAFDMETTTLSFSLKAQAPTRPPGAPAGVKIPGSAFPVSKHPDREFVFKCTFKFEGQAPIAVTSSKFHMQQKQNVAGEYVLQGDVVYTPQHQYGADHSARVTTTLNGPAAPVAVSVSAAAAAAPTGGGGGGGGEAARGVAAPVIDLKAWEKDNKKRYGGINKDRDLVPLSYKFGVDVKYRENGGNKSHVKMRLYTGLLVKLGIYRDVRTAPLAEAVAYNSAVLDRVEQELKAYREQQAAAVVQHVGQRRQRMGGDGGEDEAAAQPKASRARREVVHASALAPPVVLPLEPPSVPGGEDEVPSVVTSTTADSGDDDEHADSAMGYDSDDFLSGPPFNGDISAVMGPGVPLAGFATGACIPPSAPRGGDW